MPTQKAMTERRVEAFLLDLLEMFDPDDADSYDLHARGFPGVRRTETFAETSMLTSNHGLVIAFEDGSEYQLTIVESRRSRLAADEDEGETDDAR